jgi:hypothetical protein
MVRLRLRGPARSKVISAALAYVWEDRIFVFEIGELIEL